MPDERCRFGLKRHLEIDAAGDPHAPSGDGLGGEIDWDLIEAHTTCGG